MVLGSVVLLALATAVPGSPSFVTVVSNTGERRIPVRVDVTEGPMIPAGLFLSALGGSASSDGVWADVKLGSASFRFLIGATVLLRGDRIYPLAAPARTHHDSLFLPLQFASETLPLLHGDRFRYDVARARLSDRGVVRTVVSPNAAKRAGKASVRRVTIDPGHGGRDPGNLGKYLPRGVNEKHVNLQVGLLLRDELEARGIKVTMTRTRDTLIDLGRRGSYCSDDCDLFVSLHVNSLPARTGYTNVRGFETYFLAEARTEDAARVARMENEAVRFDPPDATLPDADGIDFILKDLQLNEHLREAARAAELIQEELDKVHSGPNRGVKQAGLMVLNTARRPALLVEMGYATNREDARIMYEPASQRRLAKAMADAIERYVDEYGRRTGDTQATGSRGSPDDK